MRKRAIVFLAEGFEEMEAVICIDILRRGGIEVAVAAVGDNIIVKGSRNISVKADINLADIAALPDAIIFPGGLKGAENLAASERLKELTVTCFREGGIIAAICASSAYVLASFGILEGRKATCYPGAETRFGKETIYLKQDVVVDGNIVTSAGPGTAFGFALTLVTMLAGESIALDVKKKALIGKYDKSHIL